MVEFALYRSQVVSEGDSPFARVRGFSIEHRHEKSHAIGTLPTFLRGTIVLIVLNIYDFFE